ncbi:YidB family protein [Dyella subtropica]|uniref:YidB family protein n=1 Tax=Dyella subtropica TaxID=2992127 RepID=UPI002254B6AA|nr:YidB family protein [Dyella subtropica]
MSLLGDLGGLLGGLAGQQGGQAGGGSLISVAGDLIQKAGGIEGLTNMLHQGGLGAAAQSWVGSGANQAVSGDQLGQALQSGGLGSVLQEAASKLGMDQGQLTDALAQVLPHAVDHLTPNGEVPQGGAGGLDLGSLASLAGKLFGKTP